MTSGIALCAQPSDVNRQTTIAAHIPPEIAAILQPAPKQYVCERPLRSVLMAASIGWLLGRFWKGR